ncbi:maleylpyruvate isomerase family mycothiol-dependent enzyme [Gordonia lacunae]|uniref:maleylpyruvate isomerase family mycothiol-dependent enzyme n=1 Tax=Gordonia lacunae TaxID=417102 RepID=UPI0039E33D4F
MTTTGGQRDAASIQHLVGPQYHQLADAVQAQSPTIADRETLCEGWTVRNVIAHLTMAARYDGQAFQAELAATDHDFQTLIDTIARRDGNLPLEQLLGELRSDTMARWAPPAGGAIGALTHVVIHACDITAAVGLPRTSDDTATSVVLDELSTGTENPFGIPTAGLRLVATDLDWSTGTGTGTGTDTGTVVEADAADLVLALAGRTRPGVDIAR